MYEDEQANVERSIQIDLLLTSIERLERRVRSRYPDYNHPRITLPEYYQIYPYSIHEAKQLLQVVYNLLKRLEMYLQSKNTYQYYERYFEEYHSLFNELCSHYGIDTDEFEGYENFKQLLSEQELKEFEKVERVAKLLDRPELIQQWQRKHQWSRMSIEEKLERLIDRWWKKRKAEQLSSSEPKYGAYTLKQWFEKLNLNEFQQEYAKRHPWLLASESGRSLLKSLQRHMIEGESNGN